MTTASQPTNTYSPEIQGELVFNSSQPRKTEQKQMSPETQTPTEAQPTTAAPAKKRPAFSNLDVEGGNGGAVWQNTNGKTGATFFAVQLDCLSEVEGVNITMNDNKRKVEGGLQPDYYGKQAVAWLGSSKNAGIPTMTVKLTDDVLIEAAGGQAYHEMFDNSVHPARGDAPAEA